MSKLSKKAREELTQRVLEVMLARLDAPATLRIPEVALEPLVIDEDWSLLKEFHPELFEGKPDPASVERLKATASGTRPITIRIPNRVLQKFHRQADKTGTPYQTLVNRVLSEAADAME
ncbi:MAG: BrnA antitoxin family protein [Aquabacterium sp.]|jgi:uncharacterized protein (DUF4415 family)|nr:BrnA antitoxin family protein [Aquabacterium sp.]